MQSRKHLKNIIFTACKWCKLCKYYVNSMILSCGICQMEKNKWTCTNTQIFRQILIPRLSKLTIYCLLQLCRLCLFSSSFLGKIIWAALAAITKAILLLPPTHNSCPGPIGDRKSRAWPEGAGAGARARTPSRSTAWTAARPVLGLVEPSVTAKSHPEVAAREVYRLLLGTPWLQVDRGNTQDGWAAKYYHVDIQQCKTFKKEMLIHCQTIKETTVLSDRLFSFLSASHLPVEISLHLHKSRHGPERTLLRFLLRLVWTHQNILVAHPFARRVDHINKAAVWTGDQQILVWSSHVTCLPFS